VNDVLDLKMIEANKFVRKEEVFSPTETFAFVIKMFEPQSNNQNCTLDFHSVSVLDSPGIITQPASLPCKLSGD